MFANHYAGKRVLITGHTGFKGSWLAAWLQMCNANVVGLALEPNTVPSHFKILNLDMESYYLDIRDEKKVSATIEKISPHIIFHLAAQPLVRNSYHDPLYTFSTNVMGTANLLNACRNLNDLQAVIIVTTDKCYENHEWVWGYRENDPLGGRDPYSASKACAEHITSSYRNSFFNLEEYGKSHQTLIASARAGNVIGGGDWSTDRLIPDIIRAIKKNQKLYIRNPNATRPWQHVLESLSGYLMLGVKLLQGNKSFAEAWNFAPTNDASHTVLETVKKIESLWPNFQFEVTTPVNQPHEARLLKLDSSKANTLLQWHNLWSYEKTIEMTIQWYQSFYLDNQLLTYDDIGVYKNGYIQRLGNHMLLQNDRFIVQ